MRKEISSRKGTAGLRAGSQPSLRAEAREGFPEEEAVQSRGQELSFWGWFLHFVVSADGGKEAGLSSGDGDMVR